MRRPAHVIAILALAFVVAGLAGIIYGYSSRKHWQPTGAAVFNNQVFPYKVGKKTRYRGEIILRYAAGGRRIEAPYSLPVSHRDFDSAREDLLRFPPGKAATIYVDDRDPFQFSVERRDRVSAFLVPGLAVALGAVLMLISVLCFHAAGKYLCPGCATSVGIHHKFCFACGRSLPRQRKLVKLT